MRTVAHFDSRPAIPGLELPITLQESEVLGLISEARSAGD